MSRIRRPGARALSMALVSLFLLSAFVVLEPKAGALTTLAFGTTSAFDAGTKGNPGDGNYNVETATDNPGIAADHLELASLKGDAFTVPDADANTFKWDVPSTCTLKGPSLVVRSVSAGALHLGANKASASTQAGVVASTGMSGDFTATIQLTKISDNVTSQFDFQVLNAASCQWQGKKSTFGVMYDWNEGSTADGTFVLRAYTISKGAATLRGSVTTLTLPTVWLRIARAGSTWTFAYSADGSTWITDETVSFSAPAPLFTSFLVTDAKGDGTTQFDVDNYAVSPVTLLAGGYRTAGNWTSPTFNLPGGQGIDHIDIAGAFTSTYALDRVLILQGGTVLQASEADNALSVVAAGRYMGAGFTIEIFLKGDGAGTPSVTGITVYLDSFYAASSESVSLGASSGIANQTSPDGVRDAKTEALGAADAAVGVGSQTVVRGAQTAGSFPTDVATSDDAYVEYTETTAPPQVTYKQGDFIRKTDGLGLQTVSGVGFSGKAILVWFSRQSAYGAAAGLSQGIGFASAPTQQYSVAWAEDDNVIPSNSARSSGPHLVSILLNGTPATDGLADLVGFTADGFTLNWTVNPSPAQATILHYVILGPSVQRAYVGQFVGPAAGATGLRSFTGVGFQGDAALFLGTLQTSLGSESNAEFGFGAALGPSSRAGLSLAIPDNTTTAVTEETQDNTKALIMYNAALANPTTDQLADFASFDPDGFSLNYQKVTSGDILFWALVIQGGRYSLNYFARQNVTGLQHITGAGFQPDGVLLFSTLSAKAFANEDPGAEMTLGAGSVVNGVPVSEDTWGGSNNAVSPTNANERTTSTEVATDRSLSSTGEQNTARYVSSDPDGFTLNWTKVQTATTQKYFWLAIQAEIPAGALDVRYDFPSMGYRSSADVLVVEAHVGDEGLIGEVWDWNTSTWTPRIAINSTSDVTVRYALADSEVSSSFEVLVRFVGENDLTDLVQSAYWLDYVAIEKHEFHLDVVDTIDGIAGSGPFTLRLVAGLGSAGDNFDVYVYDFGSSSWTPWLTAPFSSTDQTFQVTLGPSQVQSGEVQVRFMDFGTAGVRVSGILLVDLLEVKAPAA